MKNKSSLLFSIALVVVLLALPLLHAASVTLAWNQESDPSVVGYRIYQGVASRTYTNVFDSPCCEISTSNLVNGVTYYFAATAYTAGGLESGYSAEVAYTPGSTNNPPGVPFPPVMQSLKRTK